MACQRIFCNVPDFLTEYSLSGIPPAPLPPSNTPQIFNDAVFFGVSCEAGQDLTYSGTLPSWITIDVANSRLVGAANTFVAATKIGANNLAQNALDTWAQNALDAMTLTCGSEASCDGLDMNQYALSPYSDGDVSNPDGLPPVGGELVFDGEMRHKADGDTCRWMLTYFGNPDTFTMDGTLLCNAIITWTGTEWNLFLYDNVNAQGAWAGVKASGTTPAGIYTRFGGASATPATLTVVSIGGTAAIEPEPNCVPS